MLSIAIDRVDARYRLPQSRIGEQPRLRRIVDTALTRVLEAAIEREGVETGAHICIDAVRVLASVRLREPDSALADGIGGAIAAAIRQMIDEGSASVVHYGSRAHALVDLAASAMAGDFSRSWAWTQLGIWRADFPLRLDRAAELIVRAFADEPTHAVAAMAHLAAVHQDRFTALATQATPRAWNDLARTALRAAAIDDRGWPTDTGQSGAPSPDPGSRIPDRASRIAALAGRIVSTSAIARGMGRANVSADDTRAALAILAVLEAEPSAVRAVSDLRTVRAAIERHLAAAGAPLSPPAPADPSPPPAGSDRQLVQPDVPDSHAPVGVAHARSPQPYTERSRDDRKPFEPTSHAARAADPSDASPAVTPIPDVRAEARTRHGGLLYLIALLPRIGLIDTIQQDRRWSGRGLRWVLHQLAMSLCALEPDDPAALAFAGLAPGAPPPSALQEAASDDERGAIEELHSTVAAALHARLYDATNSATPDAEAVLDAACRRHATIVGDPGWIEVRLSLDEVSLDIRRAGFDVDPDWVPWLGIVLRFAYA